MPFTKNDIIPPKEPYMGLTYGDIAAMWWQHIMSITAAGTDPPPQTGPIFFIRGNIEGNELPLPKKEVKPFKDMAVFFPVLCALDDEKDNPTEKTEVKLRDGVRNYLNNPPILKVKIDNLELSGRVKLNEYYAETVSFIHDVPINSKLRNLFVPNSMSGSRRAVSAGWWLLLRPPNQLITEVLPSKVRP